MDRDTSAHGSELLDKANALMRRHRVYVARPRDERGPESRVELATDELHYAATTGLKSDDDIPVLTEIVAADAFGGGAPPDAPTAEPMVAATWANELVQRWLDEELPTVVLSVLDGLADRLVAEVVNRAQTDLLNAIATGPDPATKNAATRDAAALP